MQNNSNTATEAWKELLLALKNEGQPASPRGLACQEIIGYQSRIDMRFPVVISPARKLSPRFMAGEAWWILSGRNDAESIVKYAKNIARYSDNGTSFFGAYGPAFHEQFQYVVDTLQRDPDSRQAVINIWRERPPITKDVPCTLSWQFMHRNGLLHCNATMRSSDAWLGWPYDVFNFSMATWFVCCALRTGVVPGTLTLTAGSQHFYESDREGVERCLAESPSDSEFSELSCRELHFPSVQETSHLVRLLKLAADEDWENPDSCASPLTILQAMRNP